MQAVRAFVLLATLLLSQSPASKNAVRIGMLEDSPGANDVEPHRRSVRVLFYKTSAGWQAYPTDDGSRGERFSNTAEWTILFDGRTVGHVSTGDAVDAEAMENVGRRKITSKEAPPTVGKRSSDFAGFLAEPVLRPLVALSRPYAQDPDGWKPATPDAAAVAGARKKFRQRFPQVRNCENQDDEMGKSWKYADENLHVAKSYASKGGWAVVQLELKPDRCDGVQDDAFDNQWFSFSPQHAVTYLDQGMWLVDAGDYDGDGQSELIFSIVGDNQGGYRLFSEQFRKKAEFEFSYH